MNIIRDMRAKPFKRKYFDTLFKLGDVAGHKKWALASPHPVCGDNAPCFHVTVFVSAGTVSHGLVPQNLIFHLSQSHISMSHISKTINPCEVPV